MKNEDVDILLSALHDIAIDYDDNEYGLPLNTSNIDTLRRTVQAWYAHRVESIIAERNEVARILGEWVASVERRGVGWDDWDENYKDASYRPTPAREIIDIYIAKAFLEVGRIEEAREKMISVDESRPEAQLVISGIEDSNAWIGYVEQ
jgi:hypothetical protein